MCGTRRRSSTSIGAEARRRCVPCSIAGGMPRFVCFGCIAGRATCLGLLGACPGRGFAACMPASMPRAARLTLLGRSFCRGWRKKRRRVGSTRRVQHVTVTASSRATVFQHQGLLMSRLTEGFRLKPLAVPFAPRRHAAAVAGACRSLSGRDAGTSPWTCARVSDVACQACCTAGGRACERPCWGRTCERLCCISIAGRRVWQRCWCIPGECDWCGTCCFAGGMSPASSPS